MADFTKLICRVLGQTPVDCQLTKDPTESLLLVIEIYGNIPFLEWVRGFCGFPLVTGMLS